MSAKIRPINQIEASEGTFRMVYIRKQASEQYQHQPARIEGGKQADEGSKDKTEYDVTPKIEVITPYKKTPASKPG